MTNKTQRLNLQIQSCLKEMSSSVTLVAVTKTVPFDVVNQALEFGLTDIGENRIQVAKEKFPLLKYPCKKHLIGHLQSNKAREAVSLFDCIHSVDSLNLAQKIDNECEKQNKEIKIFYQINISCEESKSGFTEKEFEENFEKLLSLKNIKIIGFMTMAPFSSDPEDSREYFRRLKKLADKYNLSDLSMGMSGDYKIAIEEGATFVRIGRKLFA